MSQVRPEWPLEAESQWNIFLKLVGATGLLGAARLALRAAACAAFNLACGHVVEPGLFYVAGSTRVAIRDRIAMEYFFEIGRGNRITRRCAPRPSGRRVRGVQLGLRPCGRTWLVLCRRFDPSGHSRPNCNGIFF